jgi:thiol-disulfide isomerase/thioredoxin
VIDIRYTGWLFFIALFACNNNKVVESEVSAQSELNTSIIKLTGLNGQPVNMEQYKGKTIFINFWATWCKPCIQEMPSIQKAMGVLNNENIEFLFASDETIEQIEKFKKQNMYNFNFVRAENIAELNIMALPSTFIFNPAGKLVFNEMGYRQWDNKSNIDLIINISKER